MTHRSQPMLREVTCESSPRRCGARSSARWANTAGSNVASNAAADLGGIIVTCRGAGNARRIRCGHGMVRGSTNGRRHGPAHGAVLPHCARSPQCPRLCGDVASDDVGDRA